MSRKITKVYFNTRFSTDIKIKINIINITSNHLSNDNVIYMQIYINHHQELVEKTIYIIYHAIVYQPSPSISSNTYIIYYADIHMHTICIKDSLQKATSGTLFKIKFCCLYSGFPLLQFEQINLFQSYSLCRSNAAHGNSRCS